MTIYTTLVSCADLERHLDDPNWLVFDCRNELIDPEAGPRAYLAGHIPGARHVHLENTLSGAITGHTGRHPLPSPEVFCERMSVLGMEHGRQVVAYDAAGGVMASRLWWMLRWLGHEQVSVLDGGWSAWVEQRRPITSTVPGPVRGCFRGTSRSWTVDAAFIQARLGDPTLLVLDARAADRFRGENETLDPVGGHIPGARNRPFSQNLTPAGMFKRPDELRQELSLALAGTPAENVVHQCGSGVSACHNLLAMEVAGLAGSRLYPGSWSEWCADAARPIARG